MSKRATPDRKPWLTPSTLVILVLGGVVASSYFFPREPAGLTLRYGEFKQALQAPGVTVQKLRVGRAEIRGEFLTRDRLIGPAADGEPAGEAARVVPFRVARQGLEFDEELQFLLDRYAASVYQGDEDDSAARGLASFVLFGVMLVGFALLSVVMLRWVSGGGSPFSFGRSRHKLHASKDQRLSFKDVAGIDEAVAELQEVVDFLKRPEKYQALGGRIPKGVLLVGPPGTGKTLLAKAVAGEAGVPFFSMSGSDFVEMFVGVGASRVRDLFRDAESKAPCIVFIDELDALGKSRGGNMVGGHDEREQTLNQLLVEMDGFDTNRGVIIMAATNRPETLDAALLRPGRFDRQVVVDRPDVNGREAILKVHAAHVKLADDVDLRKVASLTPGSVGADLANLVNEAALLAARRGHDKVTRIDFDEAVERGAVGLERKSRIMRPEEKRRVAYHEAGHALVACALPHADPVHKVSIIPRGVGALGYVLQRPDDDRHLMTQSELEGRIKVALGGTLAEELIFAEISNGATSDLRQANHLARRMVKEFGMSKLGRIFLKDGEGMAFLAGPDGGTREYSEETAREVDLEVRHIIEASTHEVRSLLSRCTAALHAVAELLVTKEVIDGPELLAVLTSHGFNPTPDARRSLLEAAAS